MTRFFKHFLAAWLLAPFAFLVSCDDQGTQPEKQQVNFTFGAADDAANGRTKDIELPENTRLRVSIVTSSGDTLFTNHEIEILKAGDQYMAQPLEMMPGSYVLTDFMITHNGEMLYATPKAGSPLSDFVTNSTPHSFVVTEGSNANVNMQVIDGREFDPEDFGYASFKANVINVLSLSAFVHRGGQTSLTAATAELRQGAKLIKSFSLNASVNKIAFPGDPDSDYTLTVFTREEANVMTFNFNELKKQLGKNPLKVNLEPALILSLEGHSTELWEDDFELFLDGEAGDVTVHWGEGSHSTGTLPFEDGLEYLEGKYTLVVTGDLANITYFWGFAYETYMEDISGLTNLTALKHYNPTWGTNSLHIDLSGCRKLESIFIEKYGAPYTPVDLRTDFKLPSEHNINSFVFYVPGIEESRAKVTAEELEIMVQNIYDNSIARQIYDGRFIVTPVDAPNASTQRMLDELQNYYGWRIGLNTDEIYDFESIESGRTKMTREVSRETWLREHGLETKLDLRK
ncbi:MAG TPA: hypothetical protein VGD40_16200 [Chryseosolibacter sp.]